MLAPFLNIALAVLAISLLILVHEFGHFICAKAVGMRVEVFSIGFWKRLAGFRIGETDYRLSLIPLGGYVKVSGESPQEGEGKPYEFWSKKPGQRALFVAGGVAMNFVLALLLFICAFSLGVPFEAAVVGEALPTSPAWEAGVKRGDRLTRVNEIKHPVFHDLLRQVILGGGQPVELTVRRGEVEKSFRLRPEQDEDLGVWSIGIRPTFQPVVTALAKIGGESGRSPAQEAGIELEDRILAIEDVEVTTGSDVERALLNYCEGEVAVRLERDGRRLTVTAHPEPVRTYMIGISGVTTEVETLQADGVAERAGLRAGDSILKVNGAPVPSMIELRDALSREDLAVLTVRRDDREIELSLPVPDAIARHDFMHSVGFASDTMLTWVMPDSPAWRAGLRIADTVTRVDGEEVESWRELLTGVKASSGDGSERRITWVRDGQEISAVVAPVLHRSDYESKLGVVMNMPLYDVRRYGAVGAVSEGFRNMANHMVETLLTLQGIATRQVSPEHLGGIVTIAVVSYGAAKQGLGKLVYMTAVISAAIAFLNILPIPVLDGGHLLFLAIEKVRGRRLSERVMGIAQTVGLVLLILLVVYVTRNDILRLLSMT